MYMIYSFSAQPGEVSSSTSYKVSESIVSTYNKVTQQNWESWQIQEKANQINKYVRKGAHVTEYFLLAVAVSFPLYVYGVRGILLMLLAGAICVGYAFGDERHQAMVAGRVSTPRDVGIDSIGIFIGIILVRILGWSARVSVTGPRMERQQRKIQQELDRREEELAYREEMLRRRERKDDMRQTADQTFERERSQGQTRAYRPDEMTRRDRYTSNPYMESRYNQDSWMSAQGMSTRMMSVQRMITMHRMNCRMISRCFIGKRDKKRQWLLDRNERDFYNNGACA